MADQAPSNDGIHEDESAELDAARSRVTEFFQDHEGSTKDNATTIVELLERHPSLVLQEFSITWTVDGATKTEGFYPLTLFLWADLDATLLERIFALYTNVDHQTVRDKLKESLLTIGWHSGRPTIQHFLQESLLMVGRYSGRPVSDDTIRFVVSKCIQIDGATESLGDVLKCFARGLLKHKFRSNSAVSVEVLKRLPGLVDCLIMLGYEEEDFKLVASHLPQSCDSLNLWTYTLSCYNPCSKRELWSNEELLSLSKLTEHKARLMAHILPRLKTISCYPKEWALAGWEHLLPALTTSSTLKELTLSVPTTPSTADGPRALQQFFQFKPPQLEYIRLMPTDWNEENRLNTEGDSAWLQAVLRGLSANQHARHAHSNSLEADGDAEGDLPRYQSVVNGGKATHAGQFPVCKKLDVACFMGLPYHLPAQIGCVVGSLDWGCSLVERHVSTNQSSLDLNNSKQRIGLKEMEFWLAISQVFDHGKWGINVEHCFGLPTAPIAAPFLEAFRGITSIVIDTGDYCNNACVDITSLLVAAFKLPSLTRLTFKSDIGDYNPTLDGGRMNCHQHRLDVLPVFQALKQSSTLETLEFSYVFFAHHDVAAIPQLIWQSVKGLKTLTKVAAFERDLAFTLMLPGKRWERRYVDFISSAKIQHWCSMNEFGLNQVQDPKVSREEFVKLIANAMKSRGQPNKRMSDLLDFLCTGIHPSGPGYCFWCAQDRSAEYFSPYSHLSACVESWCHQPTGQYDADTLSILYGLLRESPGIRCQNLAPNKKRKFACSS